MNLNVSTIRASVPAFGHGKQLHGHAKRAKQLQKQNPHMSYEQALKQAQGEKLAKKAEHGSKKHH